MLKTALVPSAVEGLVPSVVEGLAPSENGVALSSELEELFREHHRLIYRTAYSVTGSRADAEDVLQIIFLRLLRRGRPSDLEKNPKGYLYRAAINVSLDAVRSRDRRTLAEVERVLAVVEPVTHDNADDERKRRLREALRQLSPRAVEIVILRHVHGYSDAEIARMLGTTRGSIAVTLFRARARLRTLLSAFAKAPAGGTP
jgi:RNA polymerase sigma-70 factor (ECF subfamily)